MDTLRYALNTEKTQELCTVARLEVSKTRIFYIKKCVKCLVIEELHCFAIYFVFLFGFFLLWEAERSRHTGEKNQ